MKTYSELMAERAADPEVKAMTAKLCQFCATCGTETTKLTDAEQCAMCYADALGHGCDVTDWAEAKDLVIAAFPELADANADLDALGLPSLVDCRGLFLTYRWTNDSAAPVTRITVDET